MIEEGEFIEPEIGTEEPEMEEPQTEQPQTEQPSVDLSEEDLENDQAFQLINGQLRMSNQNLDGFEIQRVTQQVVNGGFVYMIYYVNEEGVSVIYNVFVSSNGNI